MTLSSRSASVGDHERDTPRAVGRSLRCAVYTRKSSEEGLDQAFNSLDAQREAGADYIRSQRHQGWVQVKAAYDDGGFSGGSMQRPGLQRLLDDIKAGRVDVVVVYKVDRLSRSLADFARLMQLFDEHGVSFVSVTQQFNTTTSMGRLTLNMLLSFAQFEREVAGERIRDKIAATKRKGVWVTGQPPLGYRMPREGDKGYIPGDRTLRIVESEAELVRAIFAGYIRCGSLLDVARELNAAGHRTRHWTSTRGKTHGDKPLTAHYVHSVLTNPVYIGKITHRRLSGTASGRPKGSGRGSSEQVEQVYDGLHQPIIDQATWGAVHEKMHKTARAARDRITWSHTHLLKGKVFTAAGSIMSPSSVQRPATKRSGHAASGRKRVILYYVSQQAIKHGYASCQIKSVNAHHLDGFVRDAVLTEVMRRTGIDLGTLEPQARDHSVRELVRRVTVGVDTLNVALDRAGMYALGRQSDPAPPRSSMVAKAAAGPTTTPAARVHDLKPTISVDDTIITLTYAVNTKHFDGRRLLLNHDATRALSRTSPALRGHPAEHIRLALGLAFAWRDALLRRNITIADLAREHGLAEGRVHLLLTLTQLSPASIRSMLTGCPARTTPLVDVIRIASTLCWQRQASELCGDRVASHYTSSQRRGASAAVPSKNTQLAAANPSEKRHL